jgi:hypothetical protein
MTKYGGDKMSVIIKTPNSTLGFDIRHEHPLDPKLLPGEENLNCWLIPDKKKVTESICARSVSLADSDSVRLVGMIVPYISKDTTVYTHGSDGFVKNHVLLQEILRALHLSDL